MKHQHTVTIEWWRIDGAPIPADVQEALQRLGWEQVIQRVKDDYREGELIGGAGVYRGYWSIETKEAQP